MSAESSRRQSVRLKGKPLQTFKHLLDDDEDEDDAAPNDRVSEADNSPKVSASSPTVPEPDDSTTTGFDFDPTIFIRKRKRQTARRGMAPLKFVRRELEPKVKKKTSESAKLNLGYFGYYGLGGRESSSEEGDTEDEDDAPKRSSKRAKTASKGKGKGKDVGTLSLLPKMPMDILFLIFSFLPPKSLLALTRVCGAGGVTRVDFILQRRICYGCVRHNGVSIGKFNSEFRGKDPSVLKYVVPTPGYSGRDPRMYYNRIEIERVIQEFSWRKGAYLEAYIEWRTAYNKRLQDHAELCDNWLRSYVAEQAEEVRNIGRSRREAVTQRLRDMGYSDKDTCFADSGVSASRRNAPLTERSWTGMKAALLSNIRQSRTERLFHENETELAARRGLVQGRLNEYRNSLSPQDRRQLPSLRTICLFPSLHDLLVRPDGQVVTRAEVETAFAAIPGEIDAWLSQIKASMAKKVDEANRWMGAPERTSYRYEETRPYFKMPQEEFDELVPTPGLDSLELATTRVVCRECSKSWPTLSAAVRHSCRRQTALPSSDTFIVNDTGPAFALVQSSGLDVMNATADEMDEKSVFFRCTRTDHHRYTIRSDEEFIGTWREFIRHVGSSRCDRFGFREVREEWMHVYDNTDGSKTDERVCWSCSRCNEHVETLVTRAAVIEHLRTEHGIDEPHIPDDFLYAECD
ncbi:hypothetical protein VNI00_014138 [Paramarasmius palmivorus]|uniref:F-box domain-containing protein n=1 Tax=Paramarasmius palmivorus TaxID=297713 RepID=A0AAW0BV75_9AGAR